MHLELGTYCLLFPQIVHLICWFLFLLAIALAIDPSGVRLRVHRSTFMDTSGIRHLLFVVSADCPSDLLVPVSACGSSGY